MDSLLELYFTHAHADVHKRAGALLHSQGALVQMRMLSLPPQEPLPSYNDSANELAAMLRHRDVDRRATALKRFEGKSLCDRRNACDVLQGLLVHADSQVRGTAVGLLVQLSNEPGLNMGRFGGRHLPSTWCENEKAEIIALANLLDHLDEGVRSDARQVFIALDNLDLLADFTVMPVNNVAKHAREMLTKWLTSCTATARVERLFKIVDIARRPIDAGSFSAAAHAPRGSRAPRA